MTKVRHGKGGRLGPAVKDNHKKKDPPKPEPLRITLANAPILQAKFMEDIVIELKKMNMMLGDITKKLRDNG